MGDPEKLDPHGENSGDGDELLELNPASGQYDLSEDELDMGDDYIASALAALENYQEPELDTDVEQGELVGTEETDYPSAHNVSMNESETNKLHSAELYQRIEELESALKEVRRKMGRQLEEQGNDLREAKRLIRQMRDADEELKKNMEVLGKDADEFKRKWQETASSYINFQKQSKKKMGEFLEMEKINIIRQFLPVIDNMQRPLEFDRASDSLLDGVRLIYKQFEDLLQSFGVQVIPALGEKFDPYYHEAITRVQNASVPVNTVIEELQKGYQIGNRVVRPSRVAVSYGFPEIEAERSADVLATARESVIDDETNPDPEDRDETMNSDSRIKDSNPDENSIESSGKGLSPEVDSVDQRSGSDDPGRAGIDQN